MQENERYIRQIILPGFGSEAQEKLRTAKVLLVGVGGLGCPVIQYLAAAGVGTLGLMDGDRVSLSNLHRQILFAESDIGKSKVEAASAHIQLMNSTTQLQGYPFLLTRQNALEIIQRYELVIDATDNFTARYLINDACVLLNKPFIYGAVTRYEGQVTVFNIPDQQPRAINYRDLFPQPPSPGEIPSCSETGVLGVLPGIMGCLQATEAIKLITGLGKTLYGRLYTFNLLQARSFEITVKLQHNQPVLAFSDFEQMEDPGYCEDIDDIPEIDIATFTQRIGLSNVFVLDVRERHEYPPISFADAQIPMSELPLAIDDLPEKEIYIICHQGIRSLYAAQLIRKRRNLTVYSVRGGITAYLNKIEA